MFPICNSHVINSNDIKLVKCNLPRIFCTQSTNINETKKNVYVGDCLQYEKCYNNKRCWKTCVSNLYKCRTQEKSVEEWYGTNITCILKMYTA